LRLEEAQERQAHALHDAEARHELAHAAFPKNAIAAAVTNRLSNDAGSSHFQAKPMSWSIRTRGSVPRAHTNANTSANALPTNQNSPATQLKLMYAQTRTSPTARTLNRAKPMISATHQRVFERNR